MIVTIYKPQPDEAYLYASASDVEEEQRFFHGETVIWELTGREFEGTPVIQKHLPLEDQRKVIAPIAQRLIQDHLSQMKRKARQ